MNIEHRISQLMDVLQPSPPLVGLTVDDALHAALQSVMDGKLPEGIYNSLLAQLGEIEGQAFTMGLSSQGIIVIPEEAQPAQQPMEQAVVPVEQIPAQMMGMILSRLDRDYEPSRSPGKLDPKKRKKPISDRYKRDVNKELGNALRRGIG